MSQCRIWYFILWNEVRMKFLSYCVFFTSSDFFLFHFLIDKVGRWLGRTSSGGCRHTTKNMGLCYCLYHSSWFTFIYFIVLFRGYFMFHSPSRLVDLKHLQNIKYKYECCQRKRNQTRWLDIMFVYYYMLYL